MLYRSELKAKKYMRKLKTITPAILRKAEFHLGQADRVMAKLISTHGSCTLAKRPFDLFHTLVISIISQQLSAKASDTIERRIAECIPYPFRADDVICVPPERLRKAGLSSRKVAYIQGLAERVNRGLLSYEALASRDNDEVMAVLMEIPGIGRWTAEMYLIFGLKRPDVLALGDAGLQRAAKMLYPKANANGNVLEKVSERWKPYRSVASWYLWRHID
jgi:DNA-3-methyladenine glycosylase II